MECNKCFQDKPLTEFYFRKDTNTYRNSCKACCKKRAKNWHRNNREQSLKNKKEWHKEHREENLIKFKEYYRQDLQKSKDDRRKWREHNRDKIRNNFNKRYKEDVTFRLRCNVSSRIRDVITTRYKTSSTLELLGCSIKFVKKWLEFQFTDEMTWGNHGNTWHIDHFIPCASFDIRDINEQKKCFHWSNLQPLLAKENLSKNDKIPSSYEINLHQQKVNQYIDTISNETSG